MNFDWDLVLWNYDSFYAMSIEETCKIETDENDFWHQTTIYTCNNIDESFVNEIAYVMVTLHGNGA